MPFMVLSCKKFFIIFLVFAHCYYSFCAVTLSSSSLVVYKLASCCKHNISWYYFTQCSICNSDAITISREFATFPTWRELTVMELITYAIISKWRRPNNATNVLARILHTTYWVSSSSATTLSSATTTQFDSSTGTTTSCPLSCA